MSIRKEIREILQRPIGVPEAYMDAVCDSLVELVLKELEGLKKHGTYENIVYKHDVDERIAELRRG